MSDKRRTLSVIKADKYPSKEKAFIQFKGKYQYQIKKKHQNTNAALSLSLSLSLEMWILIDIQKSVKTEIIIEDSFHHI